MLMFIEKDDFSNRKQSFIIKKHDHISTSLELESIHIFNIEFNKSDTL